MARTRNDRSRSTSPRASKRGKKEEEDDETMEDLEKDPLSQDQDTRKKKEKRRTSPRASKRGKKEEEDDETMEDLEKDPLSQDQDTRKKKEKRRKRKKKEKGPSGSDVMGSPKAVSDLGQNPSDSDSEEERPKKRRAVPVMPVMDADSSPSPLPERTRQRTSSDDRTKAQLEIDFKMDPMTSPIMVGGRKLRGGPRKEEQEPKQTPHKNPVKAPQKGTRQSTRTVRKVSPASTSKSSYTPLRTPPDSLLADNVLPLPPTAFDRNANTPTIGMEKQSQIGSKLEGGLEHPPPSYHQEAAPGSQLTTIAPDENKDMSSPEENESKTSNSSLWPLNRVYAILAICYISFLLAWWSKTYPIPLLNLRASQAPPCFRNNVHSPIQYQGVCATDDPTLFPTCPRHALCFGGKAHDCRFGGQSDELKDPKYYYELVGDQSWCAWTQSVNTSFAAVVKTVQRWTLAHTCRNGQPSDRLEYLEPVWLEGTQPLFVLVDVIKQLWAQDNHQMKPFDVRHPGDACTFVNMVNDVTGQLSLSAMPRNPAAPVPLLSSKPDIPAGTQLVGLSLESAQKKSWFPLSIQCWWYGMPRAKKEKQQTTQARSNESATSRQQHPPMTELQDFPNKTAKSPESGTAHYKSNKTHDSVHDQSNKQKPNGNNKTDASNKATKEEIFDGHTAKDEVNKQLHSSTTTKKSFFHVGWSAVARKLKALRQPTPKKSPHAQRMTDSTNSMKKEKPAPKEKLLGIVPVDRPAPKRVLMSMVSASRSAKAPSTVPPPVVEDPTKAAPLKNRAKQGQPLVRSSPQSKLKQSKDEGMNQVHSSPTLKASYKAPKLVQVLLPPIIGRLTNVTNSDSSLLSSTSFYSDYGTYYLYPTVSIVGLTIVLWLQYQQHQSKKQRAWNPEIARMKEMALNRIHEATNGGWNLSHLREAVQAEAENGHPHTPRRHLERDIWPLVVYELERDDRICFSQVFSRSMGRDHTVVSWAEQDSDNTNEEPQPPRRSKRNVTFAVTPEEC